MLIEGKNTYADLDFANDYFSTRFNSPDWSGKTDNEKESILKMAAIMFDDFCSFAGYKTDSAQEMAFPRNGETTIPEKVKIGQLEIAVEIINQSGANSQDEAPLKKLKVDAIEFEFNTNETINKTYYNNLFQSLVKPFCVVFQAGGFGSSPVIRT